MENKNQYYKWKSELNTIEISMVNNAIESGMISKNYRKFEILIYGFYPVNKIYLIKSDRWFTFHYSNLEFHNECNINFERDKKINELFSE